MKRLFLPLLVLGLFTTLQVKAQVVITAVNSPYKQDFDSLAATNNGDTSNVMPKGWYFAKPKVYSKTYKVDNGGANSGNVYSYGSTSSSDRALGTVGSGSTAPIFGVSFTNGTGKTVSSVKFKYIVEQWRLGATGRRDTAKCELSVNAKSVDDASATWVRVSQLDLLSPVSTGTTGALDGNAGANEDTVDYTVTGLFLVNGFTVWVRWTDIDIKGSDDGLAMDDFELTANPVAAPLNPSVSFATTATTVAEDVDSVQVSLSIKNPSATNSTSVDVAVSGASTATAGSDYTYSGGTYTFPAASTSNISFWVKVTDDKKPEGSETIMLALKNPTNSATLGDSTMIITITDNDSIDRHYKIREVKTLDASNKPDSLSKMAILSGIVSSINYNTTGLNFFMYDSTGGINVFSSSKTYGYTPKIGDSIVVSGKIAFFNGLTEISLGSLATDTIDVHGNGFPVKKPLIVKTLDESTESNLVKLENVWIINPSKWSGTGNYSVNITNGLDSFLLFVDKDIDLHSMPAPKGKFDVIGIGSQYSLTPYDTGYELLPRMITDIKQVRLYTISELRANDANGKPVLLDSVVRIKGIVQSGNFTPAGAEFYIYDNTGGVNVYSGKPVFGYSVNMGDSVEVEGKVSFYNGLTEVIFSTPGKDTIIKISSGNTVKAPKEILSMDESIEGSLVIFKDAKLVTPSQWTGAGSGFNVDITNGTDTIQMRIDKDIDLYSMPAPTGKFNVTGIVGQFDNSSPYFSGYQLLPRMSSDIEMIEMPVRLHSISEIEANDANGMPVLMDTMVMVKGIVSSKATNFNKSASGLQIAIYDNTGGMTVFFNNKDYGYMPAEGDSVMVKGKVGFYNGLTEIVLSGQAGMDTIAKLNGGHTVAAPKVVTVLDESTESELVTIENLQLVNPAAWTTGTGNGGFTVRAYKGTDTFDIRIDNDVDLYNMAAPSGTFSVTGIGSQFDNSSPYGSGYQLMPRDSNDISMVSGIAKTSHSDATLDVYPNPASGMVTVLTSAHADVISVVDMIGRQVMSLRPTSTKTTLDVAALKPGVYFIQVMDGESTATRKLIKR